MTLNRILHNYGETLQRSTEHRLVSWAPVQIASGPQRKHFNRTAFESLIKNDFTNCQMFSWYTCLHTHKLFVESKVESQFQTLNTPSFKTCKAVFRLTTALHHKSSRGRNRVATREKMKYKQFRLKAQEKPRIFTLNLWKHWKVTTIVITPLLLCICICMLELRSSYIMIFYLPCAFACMWLVNGVWSFFCQTTLHFSASALCIGIPAVPTQWSYWKGMKLHVSISFRVKADRDKQI